MIHGWLVINKYLKTQKFMELYDFLLSAAEKYGVDLSVVDHVDIVIDLERKKILSPGIQEPGFVLFWDKDVRLAESLEMTGMRLFNPARSIELCDNKAQTYLRLVSDSVPQPLSFIPPFTFPNIARNDFGYFDRVAEILGYPLVLKECYGSFGHQVYLIKSRDELIEKVTGLKDIPFMLQKLIEPSYGRDIRVSVVGSEVVAAMKRFSVCGDFRSNLTLGGKSEPYKLSARQEEVALAAARSLGLDFGGIDILFGEDDQPLVCEVNSNMHFKTTLDCTGINAADYIIRHIAETLRK